MQKFFDFPTIILNSNLKLVEFKVENEKKEYYQVLKNQSMDLARQRLSTSLSFCKFLTKM